RSVAARFSPVSPQTLAAADAASLPLLSLPLNGQQRHSCRFTASLSTVLRPSSSLFSSSALVVN
ncbi:MAG: hypothetical protein Q8P67_06095, partial [archaeon]|nr:hypothetical protein [archaeon]